jgi:hypothetical protein
MAKELPEGHPIRVAITKGCGHLCRAEFYCPHNVMPDWGYAAGPQYSDVLACFGRLCYFLEGCEMLKRPVQSAASGKDGGYVEGLLEEAPNVAHFLCQRKWEEDGKPRVPGSITLFAEQGKLKACCNDKAMNRVGFVAADSLKELLDVLERKLADDSIDWRDADKRGSR